MKNILVGLLALVSVSAFAYPSWSDYTPRHIFTTSSIVKSMQGKIVINTKGQINSCGDLFEGTRYKTEVISCNQRAISLKIQYKNKAGCDMGELVNKKLVVNLGRDCFDNGYDGYEPILIINGKEFGNH